MRPVDNVFDLYRLGRAISEISRVLSTKQAYQITYTDLYGDLSQAQPLIESVVNDKLIPLDTCRATARKLQNSVAGIIDAFLKEWNAVKTPEGRAEAWAKPVGYRVSELKEQIQAFEYVFSAELNNASLYFIEQICAYKTSTLIEAADLAFPKNIRGQLPSLVVTDVRAAGRCLAFDLPTAAGFHIARAVETALLQYFPALKIDLPEYKNLGRYIETLGKQAQPKESTQRSSRHWINFASCIATR